MEWENAVSWQMAEGLRSGIDIKDLTYIDGTVYKTKDLDSVYDGITLPSYEEICARQGILCRQFLYTILQYGSIYGKTAH